MSITQKLALAACLSGMAAGAAAADAAPLQTNCATTAAPRAVEYPWMSRQRWRGMYEEQLVRAAKGGVDVMFIGDSITEMWPKTVFQEQFGRLKAANFGIGGDHTGNLLWRLDSPVLAGLKPRVVVLLIGVNNINLCGETPEQVFGGIQAVVARLRTLYPSARILLNAVLPEGESPDSPERGKVLALNRMVQTLGDAKSVQFHDYGGMLVGADGRLSAQLQPDFLHLSEPAYRMWAKALRPDIEKMLK